MSDRVNPISDGFEELVHPLSGADSGAERPWNYETTIREIETIITQIEAGELELAEVFDQFAVAVQYLNQCESFLKQRQQHVNLLIETLTDDPSF